MHQPTVAIIGAGHGGTALAAFLRQSGFGGAIVLLDSQAQLPYERPPLSKKLMTGSAVQPLLPEGFYAEHHIDLHLDTTVEMIDRAGRILSTTRGEYRYDVLVLAPGARPRRLEVPGADLPGVFQLQSAADSRNIEEALEPGLRVGIVGGGWIGLEAASSLRGANFDVTVVEKASRILARVASSELAASISTVHERAGTCIVTEADLRRFTADESGRISGMELADGRHVACQVVLVGIGSEPNTTLAEIAGLTCDAGIVVNQDSRTDDPDIYAIGDATTRQVTGYPERYRLESIPSATEQAKQVAASIVGAPLRGPDVPWFWSDQGDTKVRMAGLLIGVDQTVVRTYSSDSKLICHLKDGRLLAVEAVNVVGEFMLARRLLRDSPAMDPDLLALNSLSLGDVAEQSADAVRTGREPDPSPGDSPVLEGVATATVAAKPPTEGCRIVFRNPNGSGHITVVAREGQTLMEIATAANIPGLDAECGGQLSCGTCHVEVDPEWFSLLGEATGLEAEIIEYLSDPRPTSRLACQIQITSQLDGLTVRPVG